jgi:hypothetical protein
MDRRDNVVIIDIQLTQCNVWGFLYIFEKKKKKKIEKCFVKNLTFLKRFFYWNERFDLNRQNNTKSLYGVYDVKYQT